MENTTRVSDGELNQMRRTLRRDPHAYSEATRAALSPIADPLAFIADENVQFRTLMLWDSMQEIAIVGRRGETFNPDNYFNSNPKIYRQTHPKFKTTSRDGYLVGRDFLTNQPIFQSY